MIRKTAVKLAFAGLRRGVRIPSPSLLKKYNEQAFLVGLFRRLQVSCVLDVGANIGLYASQLRQSGFEGDIISFEPIKADYENILRLSKGDAKWKALNYALGNEDSEREFNIITCRKVPSKQPAKVQSLVLF